MFTSLDDMRFHAAGDLRGHGGAERLAGLASIDGTSGDDNLSGTAADETINGLAGDDNIRAAGGNDAVNGGDGNDLVNGGLGDDVIDGGAGQDRASFFDDTGTITHGVNVSLLLQGVAQDTGQGMDTLTSIESLSGTSFDDVLTGDNSANYLWGQTLAADLTSQVANNDTLYGGGGNDLLEVGAGDPVIDGGDGDDILSLVDYGLGSSTAGATIDLSAQGAPQAGGQGDLMLTSIENLSGSANHDTLTGDRGANTLAGHAGDDVLHGGKGADLLLGDGYIQFSSNGLGGSWQFAWEGASDLVGTGSGADTLVGGGGADTLIGGEGADVMTGGKGADTFVFLSLSDSPGQVAPASIIHKMGSLEPTPYDLITDLKANDVIDLSAIDADITHDGDQAFSLVGSLDGHAGQAALVWDADARVTHLELDVDGDGQADMTIDLARDHTDFTHFIL